MLGVLEVHHPGGVQMSHSGTPQPPLSREELSARGLAELKVWKEMLRWNPRVQRVIIRTLGGTQCAAAGLGERILQDDGPFFDERPTCPAHLKVGKVLQQGECKHGWAFLRNT